MLGQTGALSHTDSETYDEQRIFDRSAVIPIAIDARANFYTDEARFDYQPFVNVRDKFKDTETNRAKYLLDYNLRDLSI